MTANLPPLTAYLQMTTKQLRNARFAVAQSNIADTEREKRNRVLDLMLTIIEARVEIATLVSAAEPLGPEPTFKLTAAQHKALALLASENKPLVVSNKTGRTRDYGMTIHNSTCVALANMGLVHGENTRDGFVCTLTKLGRKALAQK